MVLAGALKRPRQREAKDESGKSLKILENTRTTDHQNKKGGQLGTN